MSKTANPSPLTEFKDILEELRTKPGQGGALEQIEKKIRERQRSRLYEMILGMEQGDVKIIPVEVIKHVPQVGKKSPSLMRFSIPSWKGHNEVFWKALGDYIILALWSVTDVEYRAPGGKISIRYFNTLTRREKPPAFIAEVISKIALLIEREELPTDFTRFRRMEERRGTIAGMSVEEAALFATLIKSL